MQSCIVEPASWTWNALGTWVATEPLLRRQESLPGDLAECVPAATLREWIEQEITRLAENHPERVQHLQPRSDYRPDRMLALLAYAYSRQVFSSEEIIRACRLDGMFAVICEGQVPFIHELRTFRRRNRSLLEHILTRVFLRTMVQGSAPDSCALERDLRQRAATRLQMAWQLDDEDD